MCSRERSDSVLPTVFGSLRRHFHPLLISSNTRGGLVAQLVEQRTENPGVGGSIPSQPTILFSPARKDLARVARARRVRSTRLTRTVLGLTRFVWVVVASGMTGVAGA